jgi:hypothetical protein
MRQPQRVARIFLATPPVLTTVTDMSVNVRKTSGESRLARVLEERASPSSNRLLERGFWCAPPEPGAEPGQIVLGLRAERR